MKRWLLAFFLIAGLFLWQRTTFPLWEIDLLPFQLAAYQYQHGDIEWIYAPTAKLDEWTARYHDVPRDVFQGEGFGNPFFYPPFVLPLLAPFSEVPAYYWRNVLFVINLFLIFLFASYCIRASGANFTRTNFLWGIALVLLAYPMARATHLAQIVPILVALTWGGIFAMRRDNWLLAGVLLGIVSALKIFPLALIVIPLLLKQFRTIAVWLGTVVTIYFVSIVFMGKHIFELWWTAVSEFGNFVYPFWGNQSLLGWWTRLFRDRPILECVPYTDPGVEIAKWVIATVIGGATLFVLWRSRSHIERDFNPMTGLLLSGLILALASSWEHYWLWILPIIAWALHHEFSAEIKLNLSLFVIFFAAFFILMKLTHFYTESPLGRLASGSQTMGLFLLWIWLLQFFWKYQTPISTKTI